MPATQRFSWMTLLGVVALGAAVIGALATFAPPGVFRPSSVRNPAENSPPIAETRAPYPRAAKPAPPEDGFVGSRACAACHAGICDAFALHPMGHSSALTPGPADIEDFSPARTTFRDGSGTTYKIEKTADEIVHHEIGGASGQGYDLAASVQLALGSGARGKTYGVNRDGLFYESPISWYSTEGGRWDLSPGYEHNNVRFNRALGAECLACHVGRMTPDPEQPHRFLPPYFQELSIGCERCHGPGQQHVRLQETSAGRHADQLIVNPGKLAPRLRESICHECHFHGKLRVLRYGRKPTDFRPGKPLEDTWLIFTGGESVLEDGTTKAVSQVEQMHASRCYAQSDGKLGCISCHDPHARPAQGKSAAHYQLKCNACHAQRGCTLPLEKRQAPPANDSCIYCHMPSRSAHDIVHASQTDHRVLRDPEASTALSEPSSAAATAWQMFDADHLQLPDWERDRALGLAAVYQAQTEKGNSAKYWAEAERLLLPLQATAPDDGPLLSAVASIHLARKRTQTARECLLKIVALEPKNDAYREALAEAYVSEGNLSAAAEQLAEALRLNPWAPARWTQQAELLSRLGKPAEAKEAASGAAKLDPR